MKELRFVGIDNKKRINTAAFQITESYIEYMKEPKGSKEEKKGTL